MKLHIMIFIKQEPVFALSLKISSEVNKRIEATVFFLEAPTLSLSLKTLQKKNQKKKNENRTCYRYREL